MAAPTLTEKGQIVIPADIRARYELTSGTQVEFLEEGGVIRPLVRRRVVPSDPQAGQTVCRYFFLSTFLFRLATSSSATFAIAARTLAWCSGAMRLTTGTGKTFVGGV
jgi:AbrB family looped-hinge helix DNA binding protein